MGSYEQDRMNGIETPLNTRIPGVLSVGVDASAPGLFHHGAPDSPEFAGFDVDLCRAIAGRLGLALGFSDGLWNSLMDRLNRGEFDVVCTATTITEERRRLVEFSAPYFDVEVAAVARGSSGFSAIAELHGRRVGVRIGTTAEEVLRNYLRGGEIQTYHHNLDAYRDLHQGLTDAVVDDAPIAQYFVGQDAHLKVLGTLPHSSSQYAIMLAKGNHALRAAVDDALAWVRNSGLHAQLCERWFANGGRP